MSKLLERKSRVERLREIVKMVEDGKRFSAFDLAVSFDVSLNVVYRDIKALRDESLLPTSFAFTHKGEI